MSSSVRSPVAAPEAGPPEEPGGSSSGNYGRGARVLSIGIAATGLFTFAYFSVASHVLGDTRYGAINLLWTVLFITISVIYRPVEQLLSRSIAAGRAAGADTHPLRGAARIQAAFAATFLAVAIVLRPTIVDAFDGAEALWWVLVVAALAYAGSYFARGYLAGHQWFGLYGGLVLFESVSRFCFPLAAAVGIASGQTFVALGIAAAPIASLCVIPWALRRHVAASATSTGVRSAEKAAAGFALGVAVVQISEQTLLNAAALLVPTGKTVAVVFSAFLITRAPLQLFQSIQTSLLPHLAGQAPDGTSFRRAIRMTLLAVAAFAGAVALGLLVLGPWAMGILFDIDHHWSGPGLALIAVGMGFHLASGTFNQALLARERAGRAAVCWAIAAVAFVVWMTLAGGDPLVRAEVGYASAAALLCLLLARA